MSSEGLNPIHKAYDGVRVLDLSQGIAGPYCGQILHQMGAEVTKVEPLSGDWGRTMGVAKKGFTAIAIAFNRGKQSIALDAQGEAGRELVHQLAARADVIIQSFRPGVADRLGFGYPQMKALNAGIVYASISGFGLSGPYVDRPGTDSVLQALTGFATANAAHDGTPQRIKPFIGDLSCGIYAANAIGAALFGRTRSGAGTHIDVSLLATMAALQNSSIIDHRMRAGQAATAVTYPQGIFETADGHVLVFAMNNTMFAAVCDAIGRREWIGDPRMRTPQDRIAVGDEINDGVARALKMRPTTHWIQNFRARDILYGEVKDYDQFIEDVQVSHMGLFQPVRQCDLGDLPFADLPGIAPGLRDPQERAPAVGEHTRQVLRTLGYSEQRIAQLERDQVIGIGPRLSETPDPCPNVKNDR